MDRYLLGNIDLDRFVRDWIGDLDGAHVPGRGLLEHASHHPEFGGYFLLSNIAPHAASTHAAPEEVILYAVLAVFQDAEVPRLGRWRGPEPYLDAAFAYADRVGRSGVAQALLWRVARGSIDVARAVPPRHRTGAGSDSRDVARLAAQDQELAQIDARDFRAAALLDPSLSFDGLFCRMLGVSGPRDTKGPFRSIPPA